MQCSLAFCTIHKSDTLFTNSLPHFHHLQGLILFYRHVSSGLVISDYQSFVRVLNLVMSSHELQDGRLYCVSPDTKVWTHSQLLKVTEGMPQQSKQVYIRVHLILLDLAVGSNNEYKYISKNGLDSRLNAYNKSSLCVSRVSDTKSKVFINVILIKRNLTITMGSQLVENGKSAYL